MKRFHRIFSDQRGFTMVSVMLGMFVVGLFAVGAWSAAVGDIPLSRENQDRKRAYQAAEAGLEWYNYQLDKNPAYWTGCATVPMIGGQTAPVNQAWNGAGSDPRIWRSLVNSKEKYTIEILPANGQTTCSTASPQTSALQDNTLRIRATGKSNSEKRSIVATYKRKSFLDFIYFTDRETLPPVAYTGTGTSVTWAEDNCDDVRSHRPSGCTEIQFAPGDVIAGPFHTNDDSVLVCNNPTFGRAGDKVEIAGPAPGYIQNGGCSGTPNIVGTLVAPASTLTLPPSNSALATLADANYTFTGQTCLNFTGNSVQVWTNQTWNGTVPCSGSPTLTRSLPAPNGIIYVKNNGTGCTSTYAYYQDYNDPAACGTVAVSGTYSQSTTIAAANDIILRDDVLRSGDNMLGLVANNFIRVYHPVKSRQSDGSCTNNGGPDSIQIDAAMLALNQSFIDDNWYCGATTGTLTVNGAIAQKWRGAVGRGGSSGASNGYIKTYVYDDRLKFKEPPNFLDPVQTSWHIVRRTEQQPAR